MSNRPKIQNVITKIREAVVSGNFRYSEHAFVREDGRSINRAEVKHVLENGYNEARKDEFKENSGWSYAIRGKTVDDRALRVCVGFDSEGMVVVTLIDLDKD